ncbi:MAG TPA: hypothetical protein VMM13_18605 [Euzebya sp.]|nr:hypothetical protein [Euzebya sp.]
MNALPARPVMASGSRPVPDARLRRVAAAYAPVLGVGVVLSLRNGVGAHPGGDPARDLAFRGTGLAPPLFLPAALLGAAVLSGRRDAVGIAATVVAGLVGLAFTAGTTFNLANDVTATRAAGSPVGQTVGIAALHWVFGPALAITSVLGLRGRLRAHRR